MSDENQQKEYSFYDFLDEEFPKRLSNKTEMELTKKVIRLNHLNEQLDQHLTVQEILKLKEEKTRINRELFKISFLLRDNRMLTRAEIDEVKSSGEKANEMLLDFFISNLTSEIDQKKLKEYEALEKKLIKEKQLINERLEKIDSVKIDKTKQTPEEIADLLKEKKILLAEIEQLINSRDYYMGRVIQIRDFARKGKKESTFNMLSRAERYIGKNSATESLYIIASFVFGEPVDLEKLYELVISTNNEIFLQISLSQHRTIGSLAKTAGNSDIKDKIILSILGNRDCFKSGILKESESFFNHKYFKDNSHMHQVLIFNPKAPYTILPYVLGISKEVVENSKVNAEELYHRSDLLDVLAEILRVIEDENLILKIISLVKLDPVKKIRFYRILSYRQDMQKKLLDKTLDSSIYEYEDVEKILSLNNK